MRGILCSTPVAPQPTTLRCASCGNARNQLPGSSPATPWCAWLWLLLLFMSCMGPAPLPLLCLLPGAAAGPSPVRAPEGAAAISCRLACRPDNRSNCCRAAGNCALLLPCCRCCSCFCRLLLGGPAACSSRVTHCTTTGKVCPSHKHTTESLHDHTRSLSGYTAGRAHSRLCVLLLRVHTLRLDGQAAYLPVVLSRTQPVLALVEHLACCWTHGHRRKHASTSQAARPLCQNAAPQHTQHAAPKPCNARPCS